MHRGNAKIRIALYGILTVLIPYVVFTLVLQHNEHDGRLRIVFLDVGQGDAILIESPSGIQVLVDGGPNASVLRALKKELGFFDRDIDMVVATHPDEDHIGGLVDVLKRYRVHNVLMTENKSDTPVADAFAKLLNSEHASIRYARAGQVYDLGVGGAGSTTLTVLFPDRDPSAFESNTSSIVAQLSYGDTEFMLTGDSPIAIEEYLVMLHDESLESDVLKAGHHGSRTSTSQEFLVAVHPQYAVISAGKDNRYGHPHKEVIELLNAAHIETKNTADVGSITLWSDGVTVTPK